MAPPHDTEGRFAGKAGGTARFSRMREGTAVTTRVAYDGYSDDGVYVYHGYEACCADWMGETRYAAELTVMQGAKTAGQMDLRLVFPWMDWTAPTRLVRTLEDEGLPASRGYALWAGERLDVSQLAD